MLETAVAPPRRPFPFSGRLKRGAYFFAVAARSSALAMSP